MPEVRRMGSKKTAILIALAVMVSLVLVTYRVIKTPEPSATSELTKNQTSDERWIEVSLGEQEVLLHDGDEIVGEYPVSAGVGTSPEITTYPGAYQVQAMWRGPEETVPGVFVKDIVVFDWEHGNGFHSLPMDKDGKILDPTLGKPASAGCIRLADSEAFYQFAEIDMKVVIH